MEHWWFIDSWEGSVSWRDERHLQLPLFTDLSLFKWGAVVMINGKEVEMSDFWPSDDSRPIHLKEASALCNTLLAVQESLRDHMVDAYVDNMALVSAWENQGRKDACLNRVVKNLYQVTYVNNIDLKLHYIPSKCNPADFPSRKLTRLDCMLAPVVWNLVEKRFGPHSVDLLSLDSNAMRDKHGDPRRHSLHTLPLFLQVLMYLLRKLKQRKIPMFSLPSG